MDTRLLLAAQVGKDATGHGWPEHTLVAPGMHATSHALEQLPLGEDRDDEDVKS
jgi:hypothetical protein